MDLSCESVMPLLLLRATPHTVEITRSWRRKKDMALAITSGGAQLTPFTGKELQVKF
jgi:hypothetical protein